MGKTKPTHLQNYKKAYNQLLSDVLQDISVLHTLFLLLFHDACSFCQRWITLPSVPFSDFWNRDDGGKTAWKNILVLCHHIHLDANHFIVSSLVGGLEYVFAEWWPGVFHFFQ